MSLFRCYLSMLSFLVAASHAQGLYANISYANNSYADSSYASSSNHTAYVPGSNRTCGQCYVRGGPVEVLYFEEANASTPMTSLVTAVSNNYTL